MKVASKRPRTGTLQLMSDRVIAFLGSNIFFWLIVALFVLQALWLVFSFKYAMLYDESYHYGAIMFFSQTLNPVSMSQPEQFDTYGSFIYSNASLYHYIMAFPFRAVAAFVSNQDMQIVTLRMLNVLVAVSSLFIYRKLFNALSIKKAVANTALFAYVALPITSLLSATVSYDNAIIPLTALFLLLGVTVLKTPSEGRLRSIYLFILTGLVASLIKFTFLPIFVAGVLFLIFMRYTQKEQTYGLTIKKYIKKRGIVLFILMCVPLVLLGALGVARYVLPVAQYGTILPGCEATIGKERCESMRYTNELTNKRNKQRMMPVADYIFDWSNKMITHFDTTGIHIPDGQGGYKSEFARRLPLQSIWITSGSLIILFCSVLMLHRHVRDKSWQFIIVTGGVFTLALLIFNMKSYYSVNQDLNVQIRYLLGFVPVMIAFGLMSIDEIIKYKNIKLVGFAIFVLLSTQGGGVIKHIVTAKDDWYWQNNTVISINDYAKKTLKSMVYEGPLPR